jgi:hypothetical protein
MRQGSGSINDFFSIQKAYFGVPYGLYLPLSPRGCLEFAASGDIKERFCGKDGSNSLSKETISIVCSPATLERNRQIEI